MQKLLVDRRDSEDGFTLIELLIVIIVLGILAAIVVFAVGSTRKDSVASACKTNYKSIELSAEAVNSKTGKYPVGTLNATTPTSPADNPLLVAGDKGGLLRSWPTSSDYEFSYTGDPDGGNFAVTIPSDKNVDGTGTDPGPLTNTSPSEDLDKACKGK